MPALDDYESYESDVERTEERVEENESQLEQVKSRVRSLESAIEKLEGDSAVRSAVQKSLYEAKKEQEEAERQKKILKSEVRSLLRDINELRNQNYQAKSTVSELARMGEDMSEQMEFVNERQKALNSMAQKAESLFARLRKSGGAS